MRPFIFVCRSMFLVLVDYDRLTLDVVYDDGFAASINGVSMTGANSPAQCWRMIVHRCLNNTGGLFVDDWQQSETPFVVDNQAGTAPSFLDAGGGDTFVRMVYNGEGNNNRNHMHWDRTSTGVVFNG